PQDMNRGVPDRTADRNVRRGRIHSLDREATRGRGDLRRTVAVREIFRPTVLEDGADPLRLEDVSTHEQIAELSKAGRIVTRAFVEYAARQMKNRDVLSIERPEEVRRRDQRHLLDDDEGRSIQKRAPDLERRDVERRVRHLGEAIAA